MASKFKRIRRHNCRRFFVVLTFSAETGILQCYSTSTYTKQYVDSDDEVYVTQVKAPAEAQTLLLMAAESDRVATVYTLNRDNLIPVQMVCEESGLTISSIEVSNSYYYVYLYGSTLYLPADEYTFTTTINTGTQPLVNKVTTSVEDSCDVVVDSTHTHTAEESYGCGNAVHGTVGTRPAFFLQSICQAANRLQRVRSIVHPGPVAG